MKKTWQILLWLMLALPAATGCVGQADDEEDDIPRSGSGTEQAGAPGLLLDFTATWCVNCPRMHAAIEEACAERPGQIFPVSIHFRDGMSIPAGEALAARFAIQSYPSLIVNLAPSSLTTATAKDLILSRLDATARGRKEPCAIEGFRDFQGSDYRMVLDIRAGETGNYKLAVLILKDGLVSPQTGGTDNYIHDNVLRDILSADIYGDPLGELKGGESVRKEYFYPHGADENNGLHALVFVTDADAPAAPVNALLDLPL